MRWILTLGLAWTLTLGVGCTRVDVNNTSGRKQVQPAPEKQARLSHARRSLGESESARRVYRIGGLPHRQGPAPETTAAPAGTNAAHQQRSQNAPPELQEELFKRISRLKHVTTGPSRVSVTGARAFHLREGVGPGGEGRFMVGREFAHLHPRYDGSLHLVLPGVAREEATRKGWGEPHPRGPGTTLLYGPRDADELEVIWTLVQASYRNAAGL